MRSVLVAIMFLMFWSGHCFAQTQVPAAQQVVQAPQQEVKYLTKKQAKEMARSWYTQEQIKAEADKMAIARAQGLSWLMNPAAQVSLLGVRLYLGTAWNTREEGPRYATGYGAEVFVNPFWGLDLVGRIGGLSTFEDKTEGLDSRATVLELNGSLRYTFGGLLVVQAGYLYAPRQLSRDKGEGRDKLTETNTTNMHGGYAALGATLRGVTALGECRMYGNSPAGIIRSVTDYDTSFAPYCGISLLTQALFGF